MSPGRHRATGLACRVRRTLGRLPTGGHGYVSRRRRHAGGAVSRRHGRLLAVAARWARAAVRGTERAADGGRTWPTAGRDTPPVAAGGTRPARTRATPRHRAPRRRARRAPSPPGRQRATGPGGRRQHPAGRGHGGRRTPPPARSDARAGAAGRPARPRREAGPGTGRRAGAVTTRHATERPQHNAAAERATSTRRPTRRGGGEYVD